MPYPCVVVVVVVAVVVVVGQGMLSEENWMTGNHQKLVLRGAHTGPIACIQLNGDTVVSAGADAMLQVWNRRDGGKRVQLRGHTGEVQALELRGNRAISGSADSTIRVRVKLRA